MVNPKTPIIMDHDGSADDFLSLILLLSMDKYDLKAITITPADCFIENAFETTMKILKISGNEDIPVGIGYCRAKNAFPSEWRAKPKILNALPDLINIETEPLTEDHPSAIEVIANALSALEGKAKVLMTGPCTNLVNAITQHPAIKDKIEEVIWMAGAFRTGGNVATYDHDNSAEWNVFWDPDAAKKIVSLNLNITFIPLDVTNQVPVKIDFLKKLAKQKDSFWARLACTFWATTLDTIPSYEYVYFMWDVLATSYLAIPEAFEVERKVACDVQTFGPSAGQTILKKDSKQFINFATQVDVNSFYDYLLNALVTFKK